MELEAKKKKKHTIWCLMNWKQTHIISSFAHICSLVPYMHHQKPERYTLSCKNAGFWGHPSAIPLPPSSTSPRPNRGLIKTFIQSISSFTFRSLIHLGFIFVYSFPSTTYWGDYLFFIVYSCLLCHGSGGHKWVGLSLDFLSCSFGQNLVCAHNHLNQAEELKVSPLLLMIQVASPPESLVFSSIK